MREHWHDKRARKIEGSPNTVENAKIKVLARVERNRATSRQSPVKVSYCYSCLPLPEISTIPEFKKYLDFTAVDYSVINRSPLLQ
jgi:hypothetical protein